MMNMNEFFCEDPNELPLRHNATDGGYVGIFRKIAVVGDSLASGEHETQDLGCTKGFHDFIDYSWGQYLARIAGTTVYNFTRGGMTAKEYCDSYASNMGYWDSEKACQCYIIALGVNDFFGLGMEAGDVSDICDENFRRNKCTFTGYYAKIIQMYKKISPDAKFFLVTMARDGSTGDRLKQIEDQVKAVRAIAEHFDSCYVIDLYENMPSHEGEFHEKFYTGGHLNALGYELFGRVICSYMDYIIRHNVKDFVHAGLIGTPYGYEE